MHLLVASLAARWVRWVLPGGNRSIQCLLTSRTTFLISNQTKPNTKIPRFHQDFTGPWKWKFPNSKFISSNLKFDESRKRFYPFRFLMREIYSLDPQGSQRSSSHHRVFFSITKLSQFSKQRDPTDPNRPDPKLMPSAQFITRLTRGKVSAPGLSSRRRDDHARGLQRYARTHALPPSPTPEPPALVLMIFEVVSVSLLDD